MVLLPVDGGSPRVACGGGFRSSRVKAVDDLLGAVIVAALSAACIFIVFVIVAAAIGIIGGA